ncbi:MAG: hypothetical protein ABIJ00_15350 [Candidatus Eisenbacteria bacterium]
MIELACLVLIYLLATGLGKMTLRYFGVSFETWKEESIFSIGLGLGLLAYAVFAVGILGILYTWAVCAVLVVAAIACRRELKHTVMRLPGLFRNLKPGTRPRVILALTAVVVVCIAMNSLGTLAPVSSMDALAYHFAAPKVYIEHHKIIETPWLHWHSYQPFTVQMLFTLGMLLRNAALGSLFHYGFGVLIAAGIAVFCLRYFPGNTSLLSVAIFYTTGLMTWQATSGFIDLGLAFFAFLAVFGFLRWLETSHRHWLALSGVFAGFAAGCKTTGGVVVVALAAMLICRLMLVKGRSVSSAVRDVGVFVSLAILIASPWYIKSLVQTGNPVFPFLYTIFGGKNWDGEASATLRGALRVYGFGYGIKELIMAPWNITLRGESFDYGQLVGPLYLSFIPLSLLYIRKSMVIRTLLIFCGLVFCVWFSQSQQIRFLLPVLPFLSVIAAWVIVDLLGKGRFLKYTVAVVVGLFLLFGTGLNLIYNSQFLPVVFGLQPEDEFLAEKTWFYEDTKYINENIPEDSKVLADLRGTYYLDRDFVPWGYVEVGEDPRAALEALGRHGITHIFVAHQNRLRQLDVIRDNLTLIRTSQTTVLGHRTFWRDPKAVTTHLFEVKRTAHHAMGA